MVRAERVILVICLTLLWASASAAPLKGQIRLPAEYPGRFLTRSGGFWLLPNDVLEPQPPLVDPRTEMVVTLEGSDIVGASLVKPVIRIEDARFVPAVLAVGPQTRVVFENRDGVVHQLEAAERPSIPKQRLAPKASLNHLFNTPGTYPIRCTEVPHLRALVFVTAAPIFLQPDATGAFTFPEVRPGTYTLGVWYRDQWIYREPLIVKPNKGTVEVQLKSLPGKE